MTKMSQKNLQSRVFPSSTSLTCFFRAWISNQWRFLIATALGKCESDIPFLEVLHAHLHFQPSKTQGTEEIC